MITALNFRAGAFLFSLFDLPCLKVKVSNVPFFVPEVKEKLFIGFVYVSFICSKLYKLMMWLLLLLFYR